MKKLRLISAIVLLALVLSAPISVLASVITGATYSGVIVVSNNSTATTNVATVMTLDSASMLSQGYVDSSWNNIAIQNDTGADVPFMPSVNASVPWAFWVPTIGANSYLNYQMYTGGGDMASTKYYFPGSAGMAVPDSATMEPGDNFTLSVQGNLDATVSGNITDKPLVFNLSGDGAGNVTATIPTGSLPYTEVSPGGVLTVTAINVTASQVDKDVDVYLYFDKGAAFYDALDIDFEIHNYSTSQNDSLGAVAITNTIDDLSGVAATDISFHAQKTPAGAYNLVLWRGSAVATDTYVSLGDTSYFVTVNRTAGNDTVTANIYTDSARTALVDTLVVAGYGATTYQYAMSFVNYNSGVGGKNWDGYVTGWPGESVAVIASGVTSDEHIISTTIGNTAGSSIDEWTTGLTSLAVNMGAGMIPAVLLEEQELTGAAASVTFDDIAAQITKYEAITGTTARHLVVNINAASPDAVAERDIYIRLNGDAGNEYHTQQIDGVAGASSAARNTSTVGFASIMPGTTYANAYGGGTLLIPHAFNTANHKSLLFYGGSVENRVRVSTIRWAKTAAITSMLFFPNAGDFASGSVFQLAVVDERYLVSEANPNSANVTFSGIPGTGNDLVVIGYGRSNEADTNDQIHQAINADSTSGNYFMQALYGNAAAAGAFTGNERIGVTLSNNAGANNYGALLSFYSQYAEGTNDPTALTLTGGHDSSGFSELNVISSRRNNVAAITQLELKTAVGSGFLNGSLFSLYRVPRTVISRQVLTSTANVTFSGIPQGYESLVLNVYGRSAAAALNEAVSISFNADTTAANYDTQALDGSGGAVTAARSAASRTVMEVTAATEGANEFGSGVITIPQYSKSDRHKHFYVIDGTTENSVFLRSNRWENLNPITSIALTSTGFVTGSIFELIGVMPTKTFDITVDGVVNAITDATADNISLSVPDTTGDWTFIENFVMPYVETANLTVGGNLRGSWDWNYPAVTTAPTFTDDSGNGNTATPSFRTASSDADVSATLTTFAPIDLAIAPAFSISAAPDFISSNITVSGNFTSGNITSSGVPGSTVIDASATTAGVPNIWLWGIIGGITIVLGGAFISYMEREHGSGGGTIFMRLSWALLIIGLLVTFDIFDFWMIPMYLFIALAPAMASMQRDIGASLSQLNLIAFLSMVWVGLTTIGRITEGSLITAAETAHLNNFMFTQEFKLLDIFPMPILNFDFFTVGIPSLLKWDYAFFGGNAQIIQYMLYSITAVMGFIVLLTVVGLTSSYFTRRT